MSVLLSTASAHVPPLHEVFASMATLPVSPPMPTQVVSSSTAISFPEKNSLPPEYGFSAVKFAATMLVVFPTILTVNVSVPVMFVS